MKINVFDDLYSFQNSMFKTLDKNESIFFFFFFFGGGGGGGGVG